MAKSPGNVPLGNSLVSNTVIRSSVDLGMLVREQRKRLAMKQLDIAGLGNTGNRLIVRPKAARGL
jgi:HTH-type transcriptional regulator / antitoxin HipB